MEVWELESMEGEGCDRYHPYKYTEWELVYSDCELQCLLSPHSECGGYEPLDSGCEHGEYDLP